MEETRQERPGMPSYSATLLADYMIAEGNGRLTPLHVIKLVYISHGYTLAIHKTPLTHDRIEAWRYGPVFPVLYYALKRHGSMPISNLYYCGTRADVNGIRDHGDFFNDVIKEPARDILDRVLHVYGGLTGNQLSALTHKKDTPWKRYYKEGQMNIVIPDEAIQSHYEKLIKNDKRI